MPRNDRYVVPSPKGGWDVKGPGAQRSSGHHRTQVEAIDQARQIVHNLGGGELVVQNVHGRIREKDTIAPANDPFPPAG